MLWQELKDYMQKKLMLEYKKEVHKVVDQTQVLWINLNEEALKYIEDKEDNNDWEIFITNESWRDINYERWDEIN